MTYKISLNMSEKVMNEYHNATQFKQTQSNSTNKTSIPSNSVDSTKSTTETGSGSSFEALSKKIAGGIKLPFVNFGQHKNDNNKTSADNNNNNSNNNSSNSSISTTSNTSVQSRLDLINNSKTKRPISSQMYDMSPNVIIELGSLPDSTQTSSLSPAKHSASNPNLLENSSEDELENNNRPNRRIDKANSACSSREKTPDDSYRDENGGDLNHLQAKSTSSYKPLPPVNSTSKKEVKPDSTQNVPVPAPRKLVRKILDGFVSTAQKTSPKPPRKFVEDTKDSLPTGLIEPEPVVTENNNQSEAKPLQFLNKGRAARPNRKKPSVKAPHAKIEVELGVDDLNTINESQEPVVVQTETEVKY